jgi:hypothetical protein
MKCDEIGWAELIRSIPLTASIRMETHEHARRRQCDPPYATSQSWSKKWKSSVYDSEVLHDDLQMPLLIPAMPTADRCGSLIWGIDSTHRHRLSWRRKVKKKRDGGDRRGIKTPRVSVYYWCTLGFYQKRNNVKMRWFRWNGGFDFRVEWVAFCIVTRKKRKQIWLQRETEVQTDWTEVIVIECTLRVPVSSISKW